MLGKLLRLTPAVALLTGLLVSLPTAQSQAKTQITTCRTGQHAASRAVQRLPYASPRYNQAIAQYQMITKYGWCGQEYSCLVTMWNHESGWRANAHNPYSGAHGIPQSLPGSKMASAGKDWRTNPATQIAWGLRYIHKRYGTPCGAWGFWRNHHWY
jgi:hypothetical protein